MNYDYIVPYLLNNMTPRAFQYLKLILLLIKTLSQYQSENGLNLQSLLILFAPILCKPKSAAFLCIKHSNAISDIVDLLNYLISNYYTLFEVFLYIIIIILFKIETNKNRNSANSRTLNIECD